MNLFTIIAQLINFSVLIYLLNKFLYKPVLATLEKRREDIKSKMEEIEDKLKESDKLKEEYDVPVIPMNVLRLSVNSLSAYFLRILRELLSVHWAIPQVVIHTSFQM